VSLPEGLLTRLRASPVVEIEAPLGARLAFLLRDYAWLGDDPEDLCAKIAGLKGTQSNETLARWQSWARERQLPALFEEMMTLHYDPLYARSQGRNFQRLSQAVRAQSQDLSPAGIAELARRIAAMPVPQAASIPA